MECSNSAQQEENFAEVCGQDLKGSGGPSGSLDLHVGLHFRQIFRPDFVQNV
jgi:hypothetical protein